MDRIFRILALAAIVLCPSVARAQESYEVFVPIARYLEQGDAEKLSAWFDDTLEVSINGVSNDSSRNQARQIVKRFFTNVKPTSFTLQHAASKSNMNYALGVLASGSTSYSVTVFVSLKGDSYRIQQLKIEKIR